MQHTSPLSAALVAGFVILACSSTVQAASASNAAGAIAGESATAAEKVRTRERPTPGSLTDSIKARGFWFGSDEKPAADQGVIRVETHDWGQPVLPAASAKADDSKASWVMVDGSVVNIRSAPNLSAERIGSFREGTRLRVIERGEVWTRVEDPESGQSGWMHQDFLAIAKGPGKTS